MKVELNLPALERLIGGDTAIELALRHQIAEEFAKRHLTGLAKERSFQSAVDAVKDYVDEAAKQAFDIENLTLNHQWPMVTQRLKGMIEAIVKESAQKAIDEALLKIIEYQKRYWGTEIERAVKKEVDRQIEKQVSDAIQDRLKRAAAMDSIKSE